MLIRHVLTLPVELCVVTTYVVAKMLAIVKERKMVKDVCNLDAVVSQILSVQELRSVIAIPIDALNAKWITIVHFIKDVTIKINVWV